MTIKYNDPYGNRKYAQLKGDKSEAFFKLAFDEGRFYKTDDGYILWAYITEYQGVVRSFKPENPIQASLCAIPFYSKEYEVRRKDKDGNWGGEKQQPSLFEVKLCEHIAVNEPLYTSADKAIKGFITHIPNAMLSTHDKDALDLQIKNSISIIETDSTDKVPAFEGSSNNSQRRSYGGYKAPTFEEKVAALKKQMEEDVKDHMYKGGQCLADLTDQLIKEHSDNENFIQIYFDLLIACVK